jgi:hypothetical protein
MHWRNKKCIQNFVGKSKEIDHLGNAGTYGRIILKTEEP